MLKDNSSVAMCIATNGSAMTVASGYNTGYQFAFINVSTPVTKLNTNMVIFNDFTDAKPKLHYMRTGF